MNNESEKNVTGCHITEEYARLDFTLPERFVAEQLVEIEQTINSLVERNLPIRTFAHDDEPEAWYWECDGHIMPCGGTHLESTGPVGRASVKRKNMGKGKERLIVTFPSALIDLSKYHSQ